MTSPSTAVSAGPEFDLSEDQQAVREMVRDFAEGEIRPIAAKIDETHEFPVETTRKMAELGLLGMIVRDDRPAEGHVLDELGRRRRAQDRHGQVWRHA